MIYWIESYNRYTGNTAILCYFFNEDRATAYMREIHETSTEEDQDTYTLDVKSSEVEDAR